LLNCGIGTSLAPAIGKYSDVIDFIHCMARTIPNEAHPPLSCSLGAFTLPLSDWLKKCYIEQRLIKPFEEINEKLNGKADEAAAAAAADIQAAEEGADELEGEELYVLVYYLCVIYVL
jgi:hypothetical protein